MSVSGEGYYSVGQEWTTVKMRESLESSHIIPCQDYTPPPITINLSPQNLLVHFPTSWETCFT